MNRLFTHRYDSPIGALYIGVDERGSLVRLSYDDFRDSLPPQERQENKYACGEVELQLDEYFQGVRKAFSIPVILEGTPFRKAVWNRLLKIDYGTTLSYGTLAQKIGKRQAARAVGNAVAANPIVIVVPCHRVINSSGEIGSYGLRSGALRNGTEIKKRLLVLEGALDTEKNSELDR